MKSLFDLSLKRKDPVTRKTDVMERRFSRLLSAHGLPRRLFPSKIEGFGIDPQTGKFWGRFGVKYALGVPEGMIYVSTNVSCRLPGINDKAQRGKMVDIEGMSVKRKIFGLRTMVPVESVRFTEDRLVLKHGLGPETLRWETVG